MTWYDIAGLIGVATILAGYAVATMGRLDPKGAPSLAINFAGASLILLSLTVLAQLRCGHTRRVGPCSPGDLVREA